MKRRSNYWIASLIIVLAVLLIFVRRSGQDPYEAKDFDRDPADLVYTKHARCRMDCRQIDEDEVKEILVKGKINYSKSDPEAKPDPKYALEGITHDGQRVRIVFAPDDGKIVVITAIDLEKEWPCHCN